MKKQTILLCTAFVTIISYAQMGPKLVGMTDLGGYYSTITNGNIGGKMIQYTGGANNLADSISLMPYAETPRYMTLTEASNGKLYGTTMHNGNTIGSIIEYDYTTNVYRIIVSFDSLTGLYPPSSLVRAYDGRLYGAATSNGINHGGSIFSYIPGDRFVTELINLPDSATYMSPLMQAKDSNLYGMSMTDATSNGNGGTIFRYNIRTMTYALLYTLPASAGPWGGLLEAGKDTLYGMTQQDGFSGGGTIFRYIITTGVYDTLHNFSYAGLPYGSLIQGIDGLLYGVASNDGQNLAGTIFSYNIGSGLYSVLHNFGTGSDGGAPWCDLYQASDGLLYGTTADGGIYNRGIIFSYDPINYVYAHLVDIDTTMGALSLGHLTEYIAPSGIISLNEDKFNLYPNPTNNSFTIENSEPGTLSAKIVNLLGEHLKTFTMTGVQQSFDISDLAAGIYQVQIGDGQQVLKVMKVVKE